jgi:hypothetical protein
MPPKSARSPRLGQLSISDIQQELARRQRGVRTLERKRDRIAAKLADLDAQIAALGGPAGRAGGSRTRARNESSLSDALASTLKGKTMSVTDVARAVVDNGYRTTSPNFRTMVNAALLNKKMFKRVERGQYTAV